MQIIRDDRYYLDMIEIMDFIARDSIEMAKRFQVELDSKIDDLVSFPYKFRPSISTPSPKISSTIPMNHRKIGNLVDNIQIKNINRHFRLQF
jgi:plasmid stabilization system protein ParE